MLPMTLGGLLCAALGARREACDRDRRRLAGVSRRRRDRCLAVLGGRCAPRRRTARTTAIRSPWRAARRSRRGTGGDRRRRLETAERRRRDRARRVAHDRELGGGSRRAHPLRDAHAPVEAPGAGSIAIETFRAALGGSPGGRGGATMGRREGRDARGRRLPALGPRRASARLRRPGGDRRRARRLDAGEGRNAPRSARSARRARRGRRRRERCPHGVPRVVRRRRPRRCSSRSTRATSRRSQRLPRETVLALLTRDGPPARVKTRSTSRRRSRRDARSAAGGAPTRSGCTPRSTTGRRRARRLGDARRSRSRRRTAAWLRSIASSDPARTARGGRRSSSDLVAYVPAFRGAVPRLAPRPGRRRSAESRLPVERAYRPRRSRGSPHSRSPGRPGDDDVTLALGAAPLPLLAPPLPGSTLGDDPAMRALSIRSVDVSTAIVAQPGEPRRDARRPGGVVVAWGARPDAAGQPALWGSATASGYVASLPGAVVLLTMLRAGT